MVQIYIKTAEDVNNELSMLEFNGDLSVNDGSGLPNKLLGDLHYLKDGTPMIILGHHVLYGKVVPLEKPIVLLKKVVSKVPTFTDIEEDETDERMEETDDKIEPHKTQTEYLVSAVIKRKILFNKRPRPIVYLEPKKKF